MQISSSNHKSEQCVSHVKYKNEIKAIRPGRVLNDVYTRVRKMMGAFYTVQPSGNSVTNQMNNTIAVRSDRNIWEDLSKLSTEHEKKKGGSVTVVGVYLIVN